LLLICMAMAVQVEVVALVFKPAMLVILDFLVVIDILICCSSCDM
jgi:hypothetical protein